MAGKKITLNEGLEWLDSPRPTQRTSGFERCQLQQRNSLLRSWRGQEHYQRTSV